jgi:hypothetical protein
MQIPPEDSLFSLPIWNKSSSDTRSKKFQLNPATAYSKASISGPSQVVAVVGMAVILLIVLAGGSKSIMSRQTVNVNASFNMKHSLTGTVSTVSLKDNTFSVTYLSSPDDTIRTTRTKTWNVQLPPGASFLKNTLANMSVCYWLPDLSGSLSETVPGDCRTLLTTGRKVTIEYLILKPSNASVIAKTILIEKPR